MSLSLRDLILLGITSAGGEVAGRTTIQKLTYFYGLETGIKTFHHPHYYGPYSERITRSLSALVSLGLVEEDETFTNNGRILYTYKLTEFGKSIAVERRKENPSLYESISEITATCDDTANLDSDVLAFASKVYYISSQSNPGKSPSFEEIRKKAESLGWNISQSEFESGKNLLFNLELAERK